MNDGAAADPQRLYDETYENYRRYLNPPLARIMKLSGSPVEVGGAGVELIDHTGKRYLDFAGGYGVFTLGYRHPRVVAAVKAQLDVMALSGRTMFNPLAGRLAKRLAELTPGDLAIAFFANSGTEAVEGALKLARAATRRTKLIATTGAFHGKTFGALSVSGREAFRTPFAPLVPDVVHVPFGELDALAAALDDAAAFVVEPIQAEGGVNVPSSGYLRGARALCDRAGALLVVDEVQTGLGRCGALFACEPAGVVPDVMTLAKGLGGGVPIGATVTRAEILNSLKKGEQTSTFGGNPLACAAGTATLNHIVKNDLPGQARRKGKLYLDLLKKMGAEHKLTRESRGMGLMLAYEMRVDMPDVLNDSMARGVIFTYSGRTIIRMLPPLVITEPQIKKAVKLLGDAVGAEEARRAAAGAA